MATKQGYFRDWGCFELSKLTKNPVGSDSKILFTYTAFDYNISITGVIVLSNEMIIDIILMRVWHTISSLKLISKRGQGRLPYILLLLGNICHVIYKKSNQISKNR